MKKLLLILLCLPMIGFGQEDYKKMMLDNSINFYDVCKEADKYFETHNKEVKGSGWKQYQRWRNANEYKYSPSGDRYNIDPYFSANAYRNFIQKNPSTKSSFSNGWIELGPNRIDSINAGYSAGLGRVEDFYVCPTDSNIMYIGSRSGGFWKSVDGGNSWDGGSTDFLFASGVNTIAVSPTNPDSILINVRDARNGISHGIYRSVDGGNTWTISNFNPLTLGLGGLGNNFYIDDIYYHPTKPNLIFIKSGNGSHNLYRSDDNLQTWTEVISNNPITDLSFHPLDPNIIYVSTFPFYLYISIDMGISFTIQNSNFNGDLSVSNDCPDCLYLRNGYGIWKSEDYGLNFILLDSIYSWKFAVNDMDTSNIIVGDVDIQSSLDGGQSFNTTASWHLGNPINGAGSYNDNFNTSNQYTHADLRCAKSINGVFYVGTDGFFCKSTDRGMTWKKLNQGTAIRENYKLGVSQSNHFRSISGSQDNGTSIKHKDTWIEFRGGDGMEGIIHPLNDNWMIGSQQYGSRIATNDGGLTYYVSFSPGYGSWEAPLVYSPNNQMKIYHFADSVYMSENFGQSWGQGFPTPFPTVNAAIAEKNSDIIVISGYTLDGIAKSIDGGINFTDITNNLPIGMIQDIAFDPNNDDVIIVTYATWQNNGDKVYMTTDGGNSWSNITYNLSDMPIHSVVIDHTDSSNIYLGAEIGVYTKAMNSTTWLLYNPALPNTTIEELEIVYGSNTIKAATWGRGLWEFDLVNRGDYPSILTTRISDMPTSFFPQENIDQYVTSVISYDDTLNSVYLEWSIDTNQSNNIILMTNTQDSTWVSQSHIPNYPTGTKIYFKVFAVGNNNDTSETYKFMYTVRNNIQLSAIVNTISVRCNGGNDGQASVLPIGGTPFTNGTYHYLWGNGDTTQTIYNLTAGIYSCIVTDANGSTYAVNSVIITEPPPLTASVSNTPVLCNGGNDGQAIVIVSGGTPPYTYQWSNFQTTDTATNLTAGPYVCIVKDTNFYNSTAAMGCVYNIGCTITQPLNPLSASISQNGFNLSVTISGGSNPYTYLWSTGDTTQNIVPQTNGQYWVIASDVNGCISDSAYFAVTWISTDITELDIVDLIIYPNPSEDIFTISFTSKQGQDIAIRVLNILGDEIYIENLESFIGNYSKQIMLGKYSDAIYLLEIKTSEGIVNRKLMLQ